MTSTVFIRERFEIPPDCQKAIRKWQKTLPQSQSRLHWTARYSFTFRDNGLVDEITVKDAVSGEEFSWAPPFEQW